MVGARVRGGVTLQRTKNGVGCWLKRVARIPTASRKFREPFSAFLEIFLPPLAGVYSVARRNQTPRPPTSKANIWSHATKNSRPANRRVDLFPYDAAFFAIFFFLFYRLPPSPDADIGLPLPPSLTRAPSSRCLRNSRTFERPSENDFYKSS